MSLYGPHKARRAQEYVFIERLCCELAIEDTLVTSSELRRIEQLLMADEFGGTRVGSTMIAELTTNTATVTHLNQLH